MATRKKAAKKNVDAAEGEQKPVFPRIAFSSNAEKYGQPPAEVRIGMKLIELPDAATQLAGFEHEDADLLVRAVRGFKYATRKG